MIIVNGRIESTAENIDALKAAIAAMETASRAEDGCHDYTFSVELSDPNVIRITERWATMAALEAPLARFDSVIIPTIAGVTVFM